jgi:serine/threonine-protein kinase
MGTVEYMSPEQADGAKLDNRSDLYSLGVVLYECLTGTVPFKSDNMVITLSKIIKDPLIQAKSRNNSIPDWLNSVINKILDKNKNNRFNSGAEFAAALHDRKIIVQSPATVKFDPRRTREQITPDKPQVRTPTAERSRSAAKKNGKISSDRIIIAAAGVLIVFLIAFILLRNANTSGINNSTDGVRTERIIENGTHAVPLNQSERSEEKEIPKPEQKKEKPVPEKTKPEKQKEETESVAKTSIPNVIGRQLSVAQAVINAKGLSIGSINYIDDPEKKGIVLRQIPPSGIDVKPGSPINLTIGK